MNILFFALFAQFTCPSLLCQPCAPMVRSRKMWQRSILRWKPFVLLNILLRLFRSSSSKCQCSVWLEVVAILNKQINQKFQLDYYKNQCRFYHFCLLYLSLRLNGVVRLCSRPFYSQFKPDHAGLIMDPLGLNPPIPCGKGPLTSGSMP